MIQSFRHKGLKTLFEMGRSAKIDVRLHVRCLIRLDAIDQAAEVEDINIPGFDFHKLQGTPVRYSVHVNGPWCITFEFEEGDAFRLDFENYH